LGVWWSTLWEKLLKSSRPFPSLRQPKVDESRKIADESLEELILKADSGFSPSESGGDSVDGT
jgi:hypothetical protein